MTKNDVAYDTYYFGMTKDSSGNWTNTSGTYSRTGYVAFKASESLKYVFTINFEITQKSFYLNVP